MGSLLRFGPWRVMIYTRDHGPAHVHVVGPEGRARIALNCPDGPPVPIDAFGIDTATLRRIIDEVAGEIERLCREWSLIHGND
jgi:hypothetical protein